MTSDGPPVTQGDSGSRGGVQPPTSLRGYLRGMGPGLVMGMAALGAGDLVDSSVAGANYGYALLWALAIALVARYFITSALAKYQLCNSQGDRTILDGYARLWRGFPLLLSGATVVMVFVINCYQVRGAGLALHNLFGGAGGDWGAFGWAVLVAVVSAVLAMKAHQYRVLEWMGIVAVLALVVPFAVAAVLSGPELLALLRGLAFETPADKGLIGSTLLTLALIANFGGSVANLLYTYFMTQKGWQGPGFRKVQMWDLLTGIGAILAINLMVWIVAAEQLYPTGRTIDSEGQIAALMVEVIGPIGNALFWIGLLGATFDGIGSLSFGATKMFVGTVHRGKPERARRYGSEERDPAFRRLQIGFMMAVPLVFALPSAPDFVLLTVVSNAIGVLMLPAISIGALWLTSQRRLLLPGYGNRWWETLALAVIACVMVWGTYQLLTKFGALLFG